MSGHRFGRAYRDILSAISEHELERRGLGRVVELGSGAVRVVVNLVWGSVVTLHRELDRARDLSGGRVGSSDVVRVAGRAVADYLGQDISSAVLCVLVFLEHEDCRALAHDEAAAAFVERDRRRVRVGCGGECLAVAEAGDGERKYRRLAASADDCFSRADHDRTIGFTYRCAGGRAGGLVSYAGTFRAVADSHVAGGDVADHLGDELRRYPARAAVQEILMLSTHCRESADARADVDAELLGIDIAENTAHFDRFIRGVERVDREKVGFAYYVFVEPHGRVEILYLGGECVLVVADVETGDSVDSVLAIDDGVSEFVDRVSDRRDAAHAGYDNSVHIYLLAWTESSEASFRKIKYSDYYIASPPSMRMTSPVI